jgi:L-threonylcarbamoyladenylate synthase
MKRVMPDTAGIEEAAEILVSGGVVAYPTETVYGLGADPFSEPALDNLFRVKARDANHPVLLIVADARQAFSLASAVSRRASACMKAFWPGPLSILLPAVPGLPARLLDTSGHVCVRCPGHETARALCKRFGSPLTSTSANLSGMPPAYSAEEACLPGVALGLDGGILEASPPSTVYDPETNSILRSGPVTMEMIEEACR